MTKSGKVVEYRVNFYVSLGKQFDATRFKIHKINMISPSSKYSKSGINAETKLIFIKYIDYNLIKWPHM